jgi:hypothetical protein
MPRLKYGTATPDHPFVILAAFAIAFSVNAGVARAAGTSDETPICERLTSEDFSQIVDAPTQIVESKRFAPGGDEPGYCQVSGYVSPNVGFLIRLPFENWNGKLLQLGCGGHCGSTAHVRQCDEPLNRGYACIVTDDGHHSTAGQALWAFNNWQAQIDYFVRASHVTALAGKAIVERLYRQGPRKSYFMGCSAGGREAMMQAQRFPWDFDGIIAGAPSLNQTAIRMNILWGVRALHGADGQPLFKQEDVELLHSGVVQACDRHDGVQDGLIGDPRQCSFDPADLLCRAGRSAKCLTSQQVAAVKRVYEGPTTSQGELVQLPGALRGSEKTWLTWFGRDLVEFTQEAFRYYAFHPNPGRTWKAESFDFDRDYRRLGLANGLYAAVNPDLRQFQAAGGKLLSYVGWNDAGGMPLPVIDYYETVEKILGAAATRDFYRLFVIPGMNHCTGGDGAFVVDYLSYLEAWVEKGQPPDRLLSFHPAAVEFSRPVYPYPIRTKYRGRGDPRDASSFVGVNP